MYTVRTVIGTKQTSSMAFYERFHTKYGAEDHYTKLVDEGCEMDVPILSVEFIDPTGSFIKGREWDAR